MFCSLFFDVLTIESFPGPLLQVMLTRPSHMAAGFDPDSIKGKAALVGGQAGGGGVGGWVGLPSEALASTPGHGPLLLNLHPRGHP